ncbi:MAG: TlyA family RNA methyltransferase [bacterium]
MKKQRLDLLLVERGLFASKAKAAAAVMAGLVYVDGQKLDKAGAQVSLEALIEVRGQEHPYVGRGGLKLEKALDEFKIDPKGKVCLDVGASTGGFTDCLLQRGAAKVFAVDVGYGQLAWKLRSDQRVVVMERTNIRKLSSPACRQAGVSCDLRAELAVIDVSFISLGKVLPVVYELLVENGEVVALIKPQFEAARDDVGEGGIIRSEGVRKRVVERVKEEAEALGFEARGVIESPITGTDGNVEFLIYLIKR